MNRLGAVSNWLKQHLLGMAVFALLTGVLGNFVYDYFKPKTAEPLTSDEADLNQRKAQIRTDIRDTFDEWKYSAQIMRCYVETLKLQVDTTGHTNNEINAAREAFYAKIGDISKYDSKQMSDLEAHVRRTRKEFDSNMKETLNKMRSSATPELLSILDRVCHHGASGK